MPTTNNLNSRRVLENNLEKGLRCQPLPAQQKQQAVEAAELQGALIRSNECANNNGSNSMEICSRSYVTNRAITSPFHHHASTRRRRRALTTMTIAPPSRAAAAHSKLESTDASAATITTKANDNEGSCPAATTTMSIANCCSFGCQQWPDADNKNCSSSSTSLSLSLSSGVPTAPPSPPTLSFRIHQSQTHDEQLNTRGPPCHHHHHRRYQHHSFHHLPHHCDVECFRDHPENESACRKSSPLATYPTKNTKRRRYSSRCNTVLNAERSLVTRILVAAVMTLQLVAIVYATVKPSKSLTMLGPMFLLMLISGMASAAAFPPQTLSGGSGQVAPYAEETMPPDMLLSLFLPPSNVPQKETPIRDVPHRCAALALDAPTLKFVDEEPPRIIHNPNASGSGFGCRRIFECKVLSSPPETNIYWYRNGKIIKASMLRDPTLNNVERTAVDESSSPLEAAAAEQPMLGLSQLTHRICLDGYISPRQPSAFKCRIQSVCEPDVLLESATFNINPYELRASGRPLLINMSGNSKRNDNAAEADAASTRRRFRRKSDETPLITTITSTRMEMAGRVVQIACHASGWPKPRIEWSVLDDADESVAYPIRGFPFIWELPNGDLFVDTARTELASVTLKCDATNPFGADSDTSTLILLKES